MRTKLINQGINKRLDENINDWLDENNVTVIDIKFAYQVMEAEACDCLFALILYDETKSSVPIKKKPEIDYDRGGEPEC